MAQPEKNRVLIAGGGPVGLFAALLLGRRGIPVRLFDANDGPQEDPRAATTHPATLELLGAAGLVPDMKRVGLVAPTVQFWDRPSGEKVAEFDHTLPRLGHALSLRHPVRAVQDRAPHARPSRGARPMSR